MQGGSAALRAAPSAGAHRCLPAVYTCRPSRLLKLACPLTGLPGLLPPTHHGPPLAGSCGHHLNHGRLFPLHTWQVSGPSLARQCRLQVHMLFVEGWVHRGPQLLVCQHRQVLSAVPSCLAEGRGHALEEWARLRGRVMRKGRYPCQSRGSDRGTHSACAEMGSSMHACPGEAYHQMPSALCPRSH